MKIKLLFPVVFAVSMAAASNFALAGAEEPLSLIGDRAPDQARADQVVKVGDDTRFVNVAGGTTVRFVVDGHSFSWTFDNPGAVAPFDLERIAPKGLLKRPVEVYVSANPLYGD